MTFTKKSANRRKLLITLAIIQLYCVALPKMDQNSDLLIWQTPLTLANNSSKQVILANKHDCNFEIFSY